MKESDCYFLIIMDFVLSVPLSTLTLLIRIVEGIWSVKGLPQLYLKL